MRTPIAIAALILTGCILPGQTFPPQANGTKSPITVKRTPPPTKRSPQIPPVLQQYDFNAQLRALQNGDVAGGSGELKPVIVHSDGNGSKLPEIEPRPEVQLTPTAVEAVHMSEAWRGSRNTPAAGPDGRIMYAFGAGLPVVVCAPLRVCIVELQAGEKIVGEPQIGDSVRWNISPGMYGNGDLCTQMIVLKPQESGLDTNLLITTDRRAYYLRLVSKPQEYVARVAFRYPEEESSQKWQQHLIEQRAHEREIKSKGRESTRDDYCREVELRLCGKRRKRAYSAAACVRRRFENIYPDEAGNAESRGSRPGRDRRGRES